MENHDTNGAAVGSGTGPIKTALKRLNCLAVTPGAIGGLVRFFLPFLSADFSCSLLLPTCSHKRVAPLNH